MLKSVCYSILLGALLIFYQLDAQELNFSAGSEEGWKAGAAREAITPPEYMWMAGYAARDKPADGKLHDLWVKALALEDGKGNLGLLITSDIIGFSRGAALAKYARNRYPVRRGRVPPDNRSRPGSRRAISIFRRISQW